MSTPISGEEFLRRFSPPETKEDIKARKELAAKLAEAMTWRKSEWKKPEATDAIVARMGHMPQK